MRLLPWPLPGRCGGPKYRRARQQGQHGDRRERRQLRVMEDLSECLKECLGWPGVRQICEVRRRVEQKGKTVTETRYAITSLGRETGPAALLRYIRGHWEIENRLHYVRDVTLGEDASQVRRGAAPEVMAALRNVTLGLLRLMASRTSPQRCGRPADSPDMPSASSDWPILENRKTLGHMNPKWRALLSEAGPGPKSRRRAIPVLTGIDAHLRSVAAILMESTP